MTFHPDSLQDLTGKVYIVTGATSGIGYYTAARLAQHGAHVYLCARSAAKASAAIDEIKKTYPQAHLSPLEMDHVSLSSVVAASKRFLAQGTVLHGLVNNAGIMAAPFETTGDGHEIQWQTNYLAHWLFTHQLIPIMLKTSLDLPSGSVRIVNLSSSGHYSAPKGGIIFDNPSLRDSSAMERYGQSKLANVLHAKTLNNLYGPDSQSAKSRKGEIWTAIVHPGLVKSNLSGHPNEIPWPLKMAVAVYGAVGGRIDADKGSWTSLFCVASQDFRKEQSGTYFQRIAEPGWTSDNAKDETLAAKLEEWTKALMKREGWIG